MRARGAWSWIAVAVLAGALDAGAVFAQRRTATEAEARQYIYGAFLTHAAHAIISERVTLGPELRPRLALPPGADRNRIYEALIALTDGKPLAVRQATSQEVADYGARRGFDPFGHPLYTVEAGDLKLLVQYDLRANHVVFAGQLGLPDPDPPPRPLARVEPPEPLAPKKPALVNVVWTGVFPYNATALTPEARAELEREVIVKLRELQEIRYVNVSGHSDPLGPVEYNRRLSEQRAESVRAYLVSRGMDADAIEVFGYGKTMPVKSCREEKSRAALIACLAPNRRVVVELQGTPR